MIGRPQLAAWSFDPRNVARIEVLAACDTATTLALSVRCDGLEGPQHTVTLPAALAGRPRFVHAHVEGKGYTLEPVVRATAPGLRIAGIRLKADLRERKG